MEVKRVVELSKDNRKILLTLWEGDKISSCVTEESPELPAKKQRCESCEGDEEVCNDYINHLKEHGYQAVEVELGELEAEESLPEFLKARSPLHLSTVEEQVVNSFKEALVMDKEVPDA